MDAGNPPPADSGPPPPSDAGSRDAPIDSDARDAGAMDVTDAPFCPAEPPSYGSPCPDPGSQGPCIYYDGLVQCECLSTGWSCIHF